MINFKISILIISAKIPKYSDKDLKYASTRHGDAETNISVFTLDKLSSYKELLNFLNTHKTIDCIVTLPDTDSNTINILGNASIEITKKWSSLSFDAKIGDVIYACIETMKMNCNREFSNDVILFSIYTPTFNTPKESLDTLYNSILSQTYPHWNWYILDDSTNDNVVKHLESYNDSRIVVFKNVSNHGNVGFNKHNIAMMCNGDWLLEIDHDDYIIDTCLETIYNAIQKFPNSKFIYSDAIEGRLLDSYYGEEYDFCEFLGTYRTEIVNGNKYVAPFVDGLNPYSIRSILAAPNHIRCFERNFYHKICGHSVDWSITDDIELISRMFLNINSIDEITYIRKILYLQNNTNTTSDSHKDDILVFDSIVYDRYDELIHKKLKRMGLKEPYYNEGCERTIFPTDNNIRIKGRTQMPLLCNIYA